MPDADKPTYDMSERIEGLLESQIPFQSPRVRDPARARTGASQSADTEHSRWNETPPPVQVHKCPAKTNRPIINIKRIKSKRVPQGLAARRLPVRRYSLCHQLLAEINSGAGDGLSNSREKGAVHPVPPLPLLPSLPPPKVRPYYVGTLPRPFPRLPCYAVDATRRLGRVKSHYIRELIPNYVPLSVQPFAPVIQARQLTCANNAAPPPPPPSGPFQGRRYSLLLAEMNTAA